MTTRYTQARKSYLAAIDSCARQSAYIAEITREAMDYFDEHGPTDGYYELTDAIERAEDEYKKYVKNKNAKRIEYNAAKLTPPY